MSPLEPRSTISRAAASRQPHSPQARESGQNKRSRLQREEQAPRYQLQGTACSAAYGSEAPLLAGIRSSSTREAGGKEHRRRLT